MYNITKVEASQKGAKPMQKHEIESMAANLYDGGWRSADKEGLIASYKLTDEEAEKLVSQLAEYERRAANWHIVLQVTDRADEVIREDVMAYADTREDAVKKAKEYWEDTCMSDQEKSKIIAATKDPETGIYKDIAAEISMTSLYAITRQESGIVLYPDGDMIITNWVGIQGMPKLFATAVTGMGEALIVEGEPERIEDIGACLEDTEHELLYDRNVDYGSLFGESGKLYRVNNACVFAPDSWA